MKKAVYLDYNATAPIRPDVIDVMNDAMAHAHNASSVHAPGRTGRKYVEDAREIIASAVNCPPSQIIFNSGATEGNNTVLQHFQDETILVSAIEHPSILEARTDATQIPVTKDGIIDLEAVENLLKDKKPALVSVMLVNNETGIIQPVKEASDLAHSHGALFHCDAVQALGRIEIDMQALGIDFMTLSAHKIGGPQGVGALCLGLCGQTPTMIYGGGQEKSARAGTENVAGIAGFGKAVELAIENIKNYQSHTCQLHTLLEDVLCKINNITIYGKNADRTPNTTLFSIPGLSSETLLMAFDLEGIAVSNGSACSSGKVEASHVLKAMDAAEEASSAIRVSTGWNSTEDDITAFLNAWTKIYDRVK